MRWSIKGEISWWPELGKLRDEARSDLVGLEAVEQWERRLEALINLEQQDTNDRQAMTKGRREEIRKAVMSRAWHLLSSRQGQIARDLLATPLRQCQGRLGQAYSEREAKTNACVLAGCCYVCNATSEWRTAEVGGLEIAKTIDLKGHRARLHSGTKVAAIVSSRRSSVEMYEGKVWRSEIQI